MQPFKHANYDGLVGAALAGARKIRLDAISGDPVAIKKFSTRTTEATVSEQRKQVL